MSTDSGQPGDILFRVYTDGGCKKPNGPGGYAAVIEDGSGTRLDVISGGSISTTNNKMELSAVLHGLLYVVDKATSHNIRVELISDSEYVVNGLNEWVETWKAFGWRKANGSTHIANLDLWKALYDLKHAFMEFVAVHVYGHTGHPQNELCDKLASEEQEKQLKLIKELTND